MSLQSCSMATLAAVLLLAVGIAPQARCEDAFDRWLSETHEPWQDELVGLWPDMERMVSIVYPVAQMGNERAQITFVHYVSLLNELPGEFEIGRHKLADLRNQAVLWATNLSNGSDKETAKVAEIVFKELTRREPQPSTPELLP